MRRLTLFWVLVLSGFARSQQIAIPRIEMMPNFPAPYQMRDWKRVAMGYDSLVFDLNRTGQYLPLIWKYESTVNYPEHASFGLETVVGTPRQNFSEAINVLPAVISATLVGIDKSDQDGENWVLMCEEYFNHRPEENIYLNQPVTQSGDDWWYETMPNVFFYQLYDLYPNTGAFAEQFTTVANQWLTAVGAMGGSTTPWRKPFMDYRAWSFSTMTPVSAGVHEPEAAGAISWILYSAYVKTGKEEYRIGAEMAMEFLNSRTSNPSYELQLAYGVYTAARMNAELGTTYDVEKMTNWCFDIGPLRHWGAIVGNWGGYDVSGLIGEVLSNEYAFAMNGFEQVAALVPMVRYDDRFSRAIGKWVLNMANGSRLFYPNFLPPQNQDSEEWSFLYDPHSYIAHEAMREQQFGVSPFSTGDAISGGWGFTNLALYGASHVGILGGITDTTNVPMVLRLDLLKTDYFGGAAYPTYLYFNPHAEDKVVLMDAGAGQHDLYDAVSNRFLATGASDVTPFTIPADQAVQLVIVPAGGIQTFELDKMMIDDVVVDYLSAQTVGNYPPRIKSLAAEATTVFLGENVQIYATVEDRDGDDLNYLWQANGETLSATGPSIIWIAPDTASSYQISCLVEDINGGRDSSSITLDVIDNHFPRIQSLGANPLTIDVGESTSLTCTASDADGDNLTFTWQASAGTITGVGQSVTWTAPVTIGYYLISCTVADGRGAKATDSLGVTVGKLVGFFTFNGNALDQSGFGNDGIVSGASLTADRFGTPGNAYAFDGEDDFVRIPVHPTLNSPDAISVNFWMKVAEFPPREMFPVSHGSWQNRWKISIVSDERLRWTVKTESGVVDLDSSIRIKQDSLYNVTVTYGNGELKLYLNGVLSSFINWQGRLLETSLDLTVAQMVPGNNQYNFKGEIDDLRIYNTVLSPEEIQALYDLPTFVRSRNDITIPRETRLLPNYPNPFNPQTTIVFSLSRPSHTRLDVVNLLGQSVATLIDARLQPGEYRIGWDATGFAAGMYLSSLKTERRTHIQKMLYLP